MNAKDIALIKALSGGSSGGSSGGGSVTVDSTLSATSTNPVQNKVIKAALDGKLAKSSIVEKTSDMTQSVGVDENGALWTAPGSGSTVTDDHINSLIDTKLGVIENGSY